MLHFNKDFFCVSGDIFTLDTSRIMVIPDIIPTTLLVAIIEPSFISGQRLYSGREGGLVEPSAKSL